jgi:hypothetical protein
VVGLWQVSGGWKGKNEKLKMKNEKCIEIGSVRTG